MEVLWSKWATKPCRNSHNWLSLTNYTRTQGFVLWKEVMKLIDGDEDKTEETTEEVANEPTADEPAEPAEPEAA